MSQHSFRELYQLCRRNKIQFFDKIESTYGEAIYPIMQYTSDKKFDNKFWKLDNRKLLKNKEFNKLEFKKNKVFESYC